ncbi:winged helix-turn-helix domain-containing tetratricopeptide repeat protein [Elioraea rosea]|uniref:winged helix-turn-helix domain-containing tetratricopeptide repeat protein n=1 Tax=Elioraea rosea TaxID=2492390 RepID=UPI001182C132|nr:winged helix-turn-helix domain-containing protein [Elioraea rosea]
MRLRFASCELDLDRQELRRSGEPVHVEPQVFDLLAHLVRNRDRVVSKDELIDTIWGGRAISEAALSSRINAARRAVGDSGEEQALIRTVHKRGFRFVAEVGEEKAEADAPPGPAPEAAPRAALPPMGRTSLAVLPFANEGGAPDTEYFAYGLTEDIIRLLARYRWLTVLSRHSTFPFRGQGLPPAEIGRALGVRYLVQGAVRRRADRVRITADLVSAETGTQLWSESFDHRLDDIFAIQDEMAEAIAAVIEPELAAVERELAARKPPGSLDAWECYQRGLFHLWGFTAPGFAEAEACFRRAVEIEPGLARAHAALSYVNLQQAFAGEPEMRPERLALALAAAQRSVALDERDCMCHCVLGRALTAYRQYEPAIAALEHSIELNPSFAQAYFALGFTLTWCGRAEESIALSERAAELSPRDPHLWTFHMMRGTAHLMLGELEAAAQFLRMALRHPSASHRPLVNLIATLGLLGRSEEAREAVAQLARSHPGFTIASARDDFFFCADEAFIARFAEGLRRAGVPER